MKPVDEANGGWLGRPQRLGQLLRFQRRTAWGCVAVGGLAALWAGCSPTPAPRTRASLLSGLVAQPAFDSPARWDYHPQAGPVSPAQSATVGSGRLYVNALGERWLTQPKWAFAHVAQEPAAEPLVSSVDLGERGWLFVSSRGTVYRTGSPLGGFESIASPPESMAEVSVTRSVVLGVTRTQGLLRSTDQGASWQPVAIAGRAVDVAITEAGTGLLLMAPERLFSTADFGAHWQLLEGAPFGALALESGPDSIRVQGVIETREYQPSKVPVWGRNNGVVATLPNVIGGRRASAKALRAGRAVFSAGKYFELDNSGEHWQLWSGSDVDVLGSRPAGALESCRDVRIAASSELLLVACDAAVPGGAHLSLRVSKDQGATWHTEAAQLRGNLDMLTMAVLRGGRWVIGGICAPGADQAGCVIRGVYSGPGDSVPAPTSSSAEGDGVDGGAVPERGSGAPSVLRPIAIPLLERSPLGMATTPDGSRVVILGGRSKGKSLYAFSSDDTLREFHAEKLADLNTDWSTGNSATGTPPQIGRIESGPDGRFGLTLFDREQGQWALLVLEADGRLVSLGRAPVENALMSAAGGYALAIESESARAWESLDGGVTWDALGQAPATLCSSGQTRCDPALACWLKGCVAEAQFSRIGWRGQKSPQKETSLPEARKSDAEQEDPLGVSIGCRFAADSEWQRVPGSRLPRASQAQLGATSWFSLELDFDHSAAAAHVATDAGGPKLQRVALLAPHTPARESAITLEPQVEGAAALRVIDGQAPEVAWLNFFESQRPEHGRLPEGLSIPMRATRWQARLAEPGLLSVSQRGLFVRTVDSSREGTTYLVKGGATQALPAMAWPRLQSSWRAEMVLTDGAPLALTIIDAGAALIRFSLDGGRWKRDAVTLGLLRPEQFAIRQAFDLAYSGGAPGFHLMFLDTEHSTARWFPFATGTEALGAEVEVPTQRDLPAQPSICEPSQRKDTPRVIVPAERGTRHAVMVTHTTEPIPVLRTQDAVLHGVPGRPCVAVYEAGLSRDTAGSTTLALVTPEATHGSWLFRRTEGSEEFDARPMTCQFDASLEVPIEVSAPTR